MAFDTRLRTAGRGLSWPPLSATFLLMSLGCASYVERYIDDAIGTTGGDDLDDDGASSTPVADDDPGEAPDTDGPPDTPDAPPAAGCPAHLPPTPDLTTLCNAACAWEDRCDGPYPQQECLDDCNYNLSVFDAVPECDAAMDTLYTCMSTLDSCQPACLLDECLWASEAIAECEDTYSCELTIVANPTACSLVETCNLLDPRERTVQCDETTCNCYDGRTLVASCEPAGICGAASGFPAPLDTVVYPFARACCGWPDFATQPGPGT